MLSGSLDRTEVWERMNTCLSMAESLSWPPETVTTLIGYTPIKKNKFFRESIIFSSRNEVGCFQYSSDKWVYIEINVTRMHRKLETIASKQ